jgi:hypothetical protein
MTAMMAEGGELIEEAEKRRRGRLWLRWRSDRPTRTGGKEGWRVLSARSAWNKRGKKGEL